MAATRRGAKKTAQSPDETGMTKTMLVRVSEELLERIDRHVAAKQRERPGWSRSDFVREAIVRVLREDSK